MKNLKWIFIAIIILASVLRLYKLGQVPLSLEWDEVALGYDAYSILNTGRDQFGSFLPDTFRSLDDYKPPIYIYADVIPTFIFGLNEFSTRLPSALFGIGAVIMTYFLTYSIFSNVDYFRKYAYHISLVASLLLAVSPWHLQLSRAAFEVNISVFITICAVFAFIYSLKKPKYFILSAFLFGLDLFSYHSTRVVAPLIMASLFIFLNNKLPPRKYIISFVIIFGFFFMAFLPILFSKEAQIRFSATNIFTPGARYLSEKDLQKEFLDKRLKDAKIGFDLAGKIFHNQRLIYLDYDTLKTAPSHYLSNFGFEYLFIRGDAPLHHAPGMGLLYIFELPFILLGLYTVLRFGLNRYTLILPVWLLLAPIPDAVTREAPHAVRTELILPMYQIFASVGIIALFKFLKKEPKWIWMPVLLATIAVFMANMSYYLHQYYVHTNYDVAGKWLYGRKEAVAVTERLKNNYDAVYVSMRVEDPYIFWLYYTKYPPKDYLKEGGTISGGYADERNHFDKYSFRLFDYNSLPKDKKILLVGRTDTLPADFPGEVNIIETIKNPDQTTSLVIAENKTD